MVSELASQIVAVAGGTAPPLVVFDFDHTVLRIHSYALRLAAADVAERDVERDAADLPFFRAFLAACAELGSVVCIASFARYDVIQAYMDRIQAAPSAAAGKRLDRTTISTPTCVGVQDGMVVQGGKVPQLEKLVRDHLPGKDGQATRASVLFFDDSLENVDGANSAGFRALCTPSGFTRRAWAGFVAGNDTS